MFSAYSNTGRPQVIIGYYNLIVTETYDITYNGSPIALPTNALISKPFIIEDMANEFDNYIAVYVKNTELANGIISARQLVAFRFLDTDTPARGAFRFKIHVLDTVQPASEGFGLELYDANGNVTFSSNSRIPQVHHHFRGDFDDFTPVALTPGRRYGVMYGANISMYGEYSGPLGSAEYYTFAKPLAIYNNQLICLHDKVKNRPQNNAGKDSRGMIVNSFQINNTQGIYTKVLSGKSLNYILFDVTGI